MLNSVKIIFLDRDGTVIVDPPDERVDREDKIELLPNSIKALKYLADQGYAVIFITNQVGIAEGRISEEDFKRINAKVIKKLLPSGIKVLNTYFCPHKAEDNCSCRKPSPKLILEAAKEFNVDLASSYMIGDRQSDIMAGVNAGTKTVLVQTGNTPVVSKEADYTAADLLEAAEYVARDS